MTLSIRRVCIDRKMSSDNVKSHKTSLDTASSSSDDSNEADIFAKTCANITVVSVKLDSKVKRKKKNWKKNFFPHQKPNRQRRQRKNTKPKKRLNAIQEILKLQSTTNLLIPRAPFFRLVREQLQLFSEDARISKIAVEALRESSEMFIIQLFEDTLLLAHHAKRATVMPRDFMSLYSLKPFYSFHWATHKRLKTKKTRKKKLIIDEWKLLS